MYNQHIYCNKCKNNMLKENVEINFFQFIKCAFSILVLFGYSIFICNIEGNICSLLMKIIYVNFHNNK